MSQVISRFPPIRISLCIANCNVFDVSPFLQMNPLIGPILETKALYAMKLQWDGGVDD